jgi:hypothetical protein
LIGQIDRLDGEIRQEHGWEQSLAMAKNLKKM